jgi:hypothetical protein
MILYTLEILEDICKKHNIILNKDYTNDLINRETLISGQCITEDCKEIFNKRFESFKKNPGVCIKCATKKGVIKMKQTNIQRYGVESIFLIDEMKEKIKQTNIEKYGCSSAIKNEKIKEKRKQNNKNKYGVEHIFQTESFINKKKETCIEKYGCESASQSVEIKEKVKQTVIERYGVECSLLNDDIKEQTILERYGSEYPIKSNGIKSKEIKEKIKEKTKKTNLEKYGVEYASQSEEIKEKIKQTNLERYGNTCALLSPIIKEKTKKTNLEKYGVENVSQNKDIAYKASINMFRFKEYVFPSGRIINYQGYENFALDEIIYEMKIEEDSIVMGCNNVPDIWYIYNDSTHRHYVDIYIKSLNKCIEVKSTWTITKKREQIFLKMEKAKELGYKYEIWVYDYKGTKIECYK